MENFGFTNPRRFHRRKKPAVNTSRRSAPSPLATSKHDHGITLSRSVATKSSFSSGELRSLRRLKQPPAGCIGPNWPRAGLLHGSGHMHNARISLRSLEFHKGGNRYTPLFDRCTPPSILYASTDA